MARSGRSRSRPLILAGALLFALAAPPAGSIGLGDPQLRSALGENLDLAVPLALAPGESVDPRCFSMQPASGVPAGAGVTLSIERSLGTARLRIRSAAPFTEAALAFSLTAHCAGLPADQRRDFAVTLGAKPAAAQAPAPPRTLQRIATTLIARIGDTLASIARAIFPSSPARERYLEAMREANPALAGAGDKDPIAPGTPVALPDLRTYARNLAHSRPPTVAPVERPAQSGERPAQTARRAEPRAPRVRVQAPPNEPAATRAPLSASAKTVAGVPTAPAQPERRGYVLKLSDAYVDLSRSGSINERQRAQLRERLMVLESDDQVSALLALRHSVRQLESRVNELQLKVAAMPSSFPAPKAEAPKPAPTPAPVPTPAKAAPPPPAPSPVIATAKPAAPEPARPAPTPAVATTPAQKPAPPAATTPAPQPAEAPAASWIPEGIDWMKIAMGAGAALLLAVAGYLGLQLARRIRARPARVKQRDAEPATQMLEEGPIVVADELAPPEAPAPDSGGRAVISSDAGLATRLAEGDTDAVRRRYIEERFPEIANGTIALEDAGSVVKGARLFYEDGAIPRAVELLQFAIEGRPTEVRFWLALFEIFRLEGLKGEYADLAGRFKDRHGSNDAWPKVQYFGREIDSGNALYRDESFKNLETIGAGAARRAAATADFDPVAENWLNAPMDFENEVLANDLRRSLMAGAGVSEGDLTPNPMPALRNVEMFRVA